MQEKIYWTNSIKAQYIKIDDCVVRYITTGKGKPLILLHTIRTQLDYFQKVIPILSERFEVYALDLPGHGLSSILPNVKYSEPYMREIIAKFISSLNLDDVTILGESIGATLALTLAATSNQNRIHKVFASNSYDYGTLGGIRRTSPLAYLLFTLIHLPVFGWVVSNGAWKPVLKNVFNGGFYNKKNLPSKFLDELYENGKQRGYPRAFKSLLRNWKSWTLAKELYKNIKVPVILIYGDSDWSHKEERKIPGKLISNSKTFNLQNAGHFACLDNPDGLSKIVLNNL